MSSTKILLFFATLLLIGAAVFITLTGPISINGLSNMVRGQLEPSTGEYYPPASTIDEISSIERYRMRMTLSSKGSSRWPEFITSEGAYVVEPPAEEFTIIFDEGDTSQRITMTAIGDTYYLQDGEIAIQTASPGLELAQMTIIDPKEATTLANNFVQLEEEPLNDRTTVHYQGDPKLLPVAEQGNFDLFDTATIDLWIDKEENFIVAMALRAYGIDGDPNAIYEMRIDYFDFNNSDIVVNAPDVETPLAEEPQE